MHEQTLIVFVIVVRGHLGEWENKRPRDKSPKSNSLPRFSGPLRLQQSHLSTSCTTDYLVPCFPHPLQRWYVLPLLFLVALPKQPLSTPNILHPMRLPSRFPALRPVERIGWRLVGGGPCGYLYSGIVWASEWTSQTITSCQGLNVCAMTFV